MMHLLFVTTIQKLYTSEAWNIVRADENKLLPFLKNDKKVIVSLSGGVDSMVMLTLLKYINDDDVCAVHIVYGNRKESEHEYRLLAEFCNKLEVPLFVYRVKWLRRGEIDRQFYEDMTRDLRFLAYKAAANAIGAEEPCVMMGHIKDDVIENVWTNIAHCHHLGNLKKMEAEEVQLGVRIIRPLLTVDKDDIYRASEKIGIPYFKNTTPSWSNRGKFREHFHKATVAQFGVSIDEKLLSSQRLFKLKINFLICYFMTQFIIALKIILLILLLLLRRISMQIAGLESLKLFVISILVLQDLVLNV